MIKKIIVLLALSIVCTFQLMSQDQAEIRTVFEKYSKQQGVVFVQLSHDILSQGSNLSLYKSMMIKDVEIAQEKEIFENLFSKKRSWEIISEIKKNGAIESGTYYVGKDKTGKLNSYLLIKNRNKIITLLYIEGSFATRRLDEELKKLKDLFIYVNDKKVKLY